MDDNHTLRSAHSNLSLRGERDTTTLRSPHSNITMRGDTGREEAVRHKMSQQTFINNEPEPMAHPVANPPEAARARKIYMSTIMGGTMMIIFIIFTIFSIYWGALYKTPSNTHKLVGWVVDFDQGVVGNAVTSAAQQLPYSPSKMTWVIKNASDFPGGPEDLANHVHQQHVWFAVSVNPGSSDALAAAIASPEQHTDYNGTLAITGYGEEARSENGYRTVLRPQFEALMEPIITRFTSQLVSQNISMLPEAQATAILRDAPQLVHRPVFYTLNNLRPFDIPVATAVTFVGLIYLLILSFLVTVISHTGREMSGYEHNLSTGKLIALRFATNIIIYFFLSLFYCLISIAFQAPFDRYLGKGGFVVYWMLQWIGMLALGFALETMITLMTNKFISIFLILWIIADVAVCFLPLELLPGVFRYGYAMPFYNVSQGVRVILFGTRNKLGLYFGVLLAWTGVSIITLPLSIILVRWLHARSEAKQKANPSPKDIDTEAPHTKHHASH